MAKVSQESAPRKAETSDGVTDIADHDAAHNVRPAAFERWPTDAETEILLAADFRYDAWRAAWIDGHTDRAVTLDHALAMATKDLERRAAVKP